VEIACSADVPPRLKRCARRRVPFPKGFPLQGCSLIVARVVDRGGYQSIALPYLHDRSCRCCLTHGDVGCTTGPLTLDDPFGDQVGFEKMATATSGQSLHGRNDVDRMIGTSW
jgi:hypothetical protein